MRLTFPSAAIKDRPRGKGIGMTNSSKYMIFGSMGAAGLVALAALIDMFVGVPFAKRIAMDIMFLLGAGIVIYMGWDAIQESK